MSGRGKKTKGETESSADSKMEGHIEELRQQLDEATGVLKVTEDRAAQAEALNSDLRGNLTKAEQKLQENVASVQGMERRVFQAESDNKDLVVQLTDAHTRIQDLQESALGLEEAENRALQSESIIEGLNERLLHVEEVSQQLDKSVAAMTAAEDRASYAETTIDNLKIQLSVSGEVEANIKLKCQAITNELEQLKDVLKRTEAKADASRQQAMRRVTDTIDKSSVAVDNITLRYEEERKRVNESEKAYQDLTKYCQTLEVKFESQRLDFEQQIKATEDRWRAIVLDTEQAMARRAEKSEIEWRRRFNEAESSRLITRGAMRHDLSPSSQGTTGQSGLPLAHNYDYDTEGTSPKSKSVSYHPPTLVDYHGARPKTETKYQTSPGMHESFERMTLSPNQALHHEDMRSHAPARSQMVPLPRQLLFDGKSTWESFIRQFNMMSAACRWDEGEKLFRLTSCLRDMAADYAFCQLGPEVSSSYQLLVSALESRFRERRHVSTYLSQLEARKLQPKEDVSRFIADLRRLVIRGYPTADDPTRETIVLRHFLKNLSDPQASISVGMTSPRNVEEAQDALEVYHSLHDDGGSKPPKARQVNVSMEQDIDMPITKSHLLALNEDLKKEIHNLRSSLTPQRPGASGNRPRRDKKNVECYNCHGMGHFANECPEKRNGTRKSTPPTTAVPEQSNGVSNQEN